MKMETKMILFLKNKANPKNNNNKKNLINKKNYKIVKKAVNIQSPNIKFYSYKCNIVMDKL